MNLENIFINLMRSFLCEFLWDFLITRNESRTLLVSEMDVSLTLTNELEHLINATKNAILHVTVVLDMRLGTSVLHILATIRTLSFTTSKSVLGHLKTLPPRYAKLVRSRVYRVLLFRRFCVRKKVSCLILCI